MIFNADPTPKKLAFLDPGAAVQVLTAEEQLPADIRDWGLLILDTNDVQNTGCVASLVLPRVREHFIIDHHETDDPDLRDNLIQRSASSTAEILYQLFQTLGLAIDLPIAEALFAAIVFDTGSFVSPKTTALTFEIARDLVSRGVEPNVVYSRLYESNTISALLLQSHVLSTLELVFDNRVAVLTMTAQMIRDAGAMYEEADQMINIPLRSEDVRVSVFFKENTDGLIRCSLRSKGAIDVAGIARFFGGGGHRTAAGFKCRDTLLKARKNLMAVLKDAVS